MFGFCIHKKQTDIVFKYESQLSVAVHPINPSTQEVKTGPETQCHP